MVCGIEERFDLVAGEGFNGGCLGFWRVDVTRDVVRGIVFFDGPGPEGAEAGIDIAYGLGAELPGGSGSSRPARRRTCSGCSFSALAALTQKSKLGFLCSDTTSEIVASLILARLASSA